jgi:hypothetical protein
MLKIYFIMTNKRRFYVAATATSSFSIFHIGASSWGRECNCTQDVAVNVAGTSLISNELVLPFGDTRTKFFK